MELLGHLVVKSFLVVFHQGVRWVVVCCIENDGYSGVFRSGLLRFPDIQKREFRGCPDFAVLLRKNRAKRRNGFFGRVLLKILNPVYR